MKTTQEMQTAKNEEIRVLLVTYNNGEKRVHIDIRTTGWGDNEAIDLNYYPNAYGAKIMTLTKACEAAGIDYKQFVTDSLQIAKVDLEMLKDVYGSGLEVDAAEYRYVRLKDCFLKLKEQA